MVLVLVSIVLVFVFVFQDVVLVLERLVLVLVGRIIVNNTDWRGRPQKFPHWMYPVNRLPYFTGAYCMYVCSGGIMAGLISDWTGARATTCISMLLFAAPAVSI